MDESDKVRALEHKRTQAISSGDLETLASVMTEDYMHVYGGGLVGSRESYIDHIGDIPRSPERGTLDVRLYGDTAVMTGTITNKINPREGEEGRVRATGAILKKEIVQAFVTQVAVKQDGEWKFCSFQLTRCIDKPS